MNQGTAENVALELLKAWLPGASTRLPADVKDGGMTGRWLGEAYNAIIQTVLREGKK